MLGCLFSSYCFSLDFYDFLIKLSLNSVFGSCVSLHKNWSWLFTCDSTNAINQMNRNLGSILIFFLLIFTPSRRSSNVLIHIKSRDAWILFTYILCLIAVCSIFSWGYKTRRQISQQWLFEVQWFMRIRPI